MTVTVTKPIEVTEAVLTASGIPEPDSSVGEVEWVADRRKVMDVDFGGQTINTNYRFAHFLKSNISESEHGSVYFTRGSNPEGAGAYYFRFMKYNVTKGHNGFRCHYESYIDFDASGFVEPDGTRFLRCCVETYSESSETGRPFVFVMNFTTKDISAIVTESFSQPVGEVRLRLPSEFDPASVVTTDFLFFVISKP